jgi:uncharacterized protein
MIDYQERNGALIFKVKVSPRASRTAIAGEHGGMLKIQLAAPPVDGAANDELTRTLAKAFGVSRSSVRIAAGTTSKFKRVNVTGDTSSLVSILQQLALKS